MTERPLQGKVASMTGTASPIGLGHAMTVALVRAGALVALLDINDTGVTTSMDTMWRKGGTPYDPAKAGHEALVAAMAQELEGSGVTANVLVPGGATYTNMTTANTSYERDKLIMVETCGFFL